MDDYIIRKIRSYNKSTGKYTYKYYDNGKVVKHNKIKHILGDIYIPPAYNNVSINKDKSSKVLAIGYDNKNRKQYIYNKEFIKSNNSNKFKQLIKFGNDYTNIINKIDRDLYRIDESKEKQIAMVLKIIIECNFRIGNDRYSKENKSYGVSTLENRHIKIKKGNIIIDFIGKKGIRNKCTLRNTKIMKNIKTKKKISKKTDRVFSYRRGMKYIDITSKDVNNYLKNIGNYTTKNFRTWGANIQLIENLLSGTNIKECINDVSTNLHHTSTICKKNYLEPNLDLPQP